MEKAALKVRVSLFKFDLKLITAIFPFLFLICAISLCWKSSKELKWVVFISMKLVASVIIFLKYEAHSVKGSEHTLANKCLLFLIRHLMKFQVTCCQLNYYFEG